jgi:hypothetical protein
MLADALIAFSIPLALLFGTSFVGAEPTWRWFYFASVFLALSLATTLYLTHVMRVEPELSAFRHIFRPTGYLSVFAVGIPFYGAAGWLDQHHYLSPLMELLIVSSGMPAALIDCHLFLRDWRYAVRTAESVDPDQAANTAAR